MRYYWNDYENEMISATKDRTELFFQLRTTNPDIILRNDGIDTTDTLPNVGTLPLFVAIADQTTFEVLKPRPKKRGRPPLPQNTKLAKKQKYLTYCESAYNASDSLKYRAYLIEEWTRTKNQIDEITKKSTDTLDSNR